MKNYLVINDLGGGSLSLTLIDDIRWAQIQKINQEESYTDRVNFIGALTCDEPGMDWPKDCAAPQGKLIKQWYTCNGVIEDVYITNVFGVLTIGLA